MYGKLRECMEYVLISGQLEITVASLGAELISVKKAGKERLWQNPTGEWAGHAPLLFPVCGHCGVKVDGKEYPIGLHGVARKAEFSLAEQGENFLKFVLHSNEKTRLAYPYEFVFSVTYRIVEDTLDIVYDVQNPMTAPLYFACGSHESYALDENVDGYVVEFEKEEHLMHYPHNAGGYLTGERVDYGVTKTLPLPRDVLQGGDTLIFKDVVSRKIKLLKKDGAPIAQLTFEGFSNLLFWRADDAKYICMEPWTNLPDVADVEDVEFSTKDGVIRLDGGQQKTMVHSIRYY